MRPGFYILHSFCIANCSIHASTVGILNVRFNGSSDKLLSGFIFFYHTCILVVMNGLSAKLISKLNFCCYIVKKLLLVRDTTVLMYSY